MKFLSHIPGLEEDSFDYDVDFNDDDSEMQLPEQRKKLFMAS